VDENLELLPCLRPRFRFRGRRLEKQATFAPVSQSVADPRFLGLAKIVAGIQNRMTYRTSRQSRLRRNEGILRQLRVNVAAGFSL